MKLQHLLYFEFSVLTAKTYYKSTAAIERTKDIKEQGNAEETRRFAIQFRAF